MKKVFVFVLACTLLLLMAGCGDQSAPAPASSAVSYSQADGGNSDTAVSEENIEDLEALTPDQSGKTQVTQATVLTLGDMSVTIPSGWYYTEKPESNALWLTGPNGADCSFVFNTDGMQAAIDDVVEFMHTLDEAAGYDSIEPVIYDDTIGNIEGKQLTFTYKISNIQLAYAYLFAEYNGKTYTNFCFASDHQNEDALSDLSVYKTTVVPTIVFS